jgi:phosphomannomutase
VVNSSFDKETQEAVKALQDPYRIRGEFYKNLEFGTGGMRGVMYVGNNQLTNIRLEKYTRLIKLFKTSFLNQPLKAVIAYDCRQIVIQNCC